VQAVLAIEDRRFFEHGGVNYWRMIGRHQDVISAATSSRAARRSPCSWRAASSVAGNRQFKRKMIEIVITFQLEHRFNKQQIFEMYANEINLGQRGSFSIDGFGEAAQAYFGKDVRQLDLSECALLAGMIQRPNYFSPFRHPTAPSTGATWCWIRWSRPAPSPRTRRSSAKAEPLHLGGRAWTPAKRHTLSIWCMTS
jgi:penicillin-binding protein 1B